MLSNLIAANKFANILFVLSSCLIPSVVKNKTKNKEVFYMNENVVKLLKTFMWDLATCSDGEPNVVPVAFKDVTDDGKLTVGGFLD